MPEKMTGKKNREQYEMKYDFVLNYIKSRASKRNI